MLFKNPEVFYYFLILVFFALLAVFRFTGRKKRIQKWLGRQSLFLRSSISDFKRTLKVILELIALVFLILALARLQGPGEKTEVSQKGGSILIMLDVSHSMMTEDVRPNRLTFAKRELSRLIDLSWGDQIALGFFGKSAFLISPFTLDLSAVKSYLKDLSTEYLRNQGTDFGSLFQFISSFFNRQEGLEVKYVVIASDGGDHSPQTRQRVQALLRGQNIRVFTLSVGTETGEAIPIRDYKNQLREYKKDSRGELVISRLNPESLKKISEWGQGAYYHLSYGGSAIEKLREDLNALKKESFDSYTEVKKQEYYQWFLIIAFIFVLSELLLTDRRKLKKAGR